MRRFAMDKLLDWIVISSRIRIQYTLFTGFSVFLTISSAILLLGRDVCHAIYQ